MMRTVATAGVVDDVIAGRYATVHAPRPRTGRVRLVTSLITALVALGGSLLSPASLAQGNNTAGTYPQRPIRLVVPYAPGGPTDIVGRLLLDKLTGAFGQPIILDNKPGAGGNIGAEQVARANPDGYTMMFTAAAPIVINPYLYARMPYDAQRDFVPVVLATTAPTFMVVPASLPVNSVRELIALAKSQPGKLDFGSSGIGTPPHLSGELFNHLAGVQINHVPYRSAIAATTAVLNAEVSLDFDQPAILQHVKSGKLRLLAVTTPKRSAIAPDTPTLAEAGVPGYEVTAWYGFLAPAGTPREIVQRWVTEVARVLSQPELRERLLSIGYEIGPLTQEAFVAFLREEHARWSRVVRESGARAD
jgi:tripartite-type tricarboxylate transporter receptor subunit TctC